MASARFMETWAHGRDVVDALGVRRADRPDPPRRPPRRPHPRLRLHRARADAARRAVPLRAGRPSGEVWTHGPEDAAQTGDRVGVRLLPAGDPAVAPRRRRPGRRRRGRDGWLTIAQAFAGPPGAGRSRAAVSRACCASATAPASTATGSPRCARCSRAGGRLDVLTGDYLAELTMLILGKDPMRDASLGYARTFVAPARGLPRPGARAGRAGSSATPAASTRPGLADRVREVAAGSGLDPAVAHVEGDDLRDRAAELGLDGALTANAYLGGFGIAAALEAGADVVVTGRVTDASLVVGPAVATSAGRRRVRRAGRRRRRRPRARVRHPGDRRQLLRLHSRCPLDGRPLGLPGRRDRRRRLLRDHQARRHRRRGHRRHRHRPAGLRDPDHPLPRPRRHRPPDSIRLAQDGRRTGSRSPASAARRRPSSSRSASTSSAGSATPMELVLTGLDIEAKADWVARARSRPPAPAASVDLDPRPHRTTTPTPRRARPACCGSPPGRRGRARSARRSPARSSSSRSASYPGFTLTAPPGPPTPYGVYRPAYVARDAVDAHGRARRRAPRGGARPDRRSSTVPRRRPGRRPSPCPAPDPTRSPAARRSAPSSTPAPATRAATRTSGCGSAHDGTPKYARPGGLAAPSSITPQRVRELVPEAADLEVEVLPAAEPRRGQRADPRAARRGRGRLDPVRPAGQGGRRVGPVADGAASRSGLTWTGAVR